VRKKPVKREDLAPGANLCDHCTGKCCRYFTVPLESPKTWGDYDAIRWYLAHQDTLVYVESGDWYILVKSKCKYLLEDNRCGIYHDRPEVCRGYTTDDCEYDTDWTFEKVFETAEQLWEYAEALLPPRRTGRKPKGLELPIISSL